MKTKLKCFFLIPVIMLIANNCQNNKPIITLTSPNNTPTKWVTVTIPSSIIPTNGVYPTATHNITATPTTAMPIVSPTPYNKNVIAFTGTGEDRTNDEIYLVYPDNLNIINLTQNPADDSYPAWSPEGTKIAFISNRNNQGLQIYVMNADGSNVLQITNGNLIPLHRPSWSPASEKIVFDALTPDGFTSLNIVDLNNSEVSQLIKDKYTNLWPAWSPDGYQIAFMSDRDGPNNGDFHIYILDLISKEIQRVTNDPAHDTSPSWSHDGKEIAFSRDTGKRAPYICIISSNGSNLKELIPENTVEGGESPSWSGNNSMIAFQDIRLIENGPILSWINSASIYSIFLMNSDGTGTERLTFGNLLAQYPDWRP